MWTWRQRFGELVTTDSAGSTIVVGTGYSGAGDGKNSPVLESVHNVGPIPRGTWTISGPPIDTTEHGPFVLQLTPATDTNTYGRSGFLIHGDSKTAPGTASKGCIILPRNVRERIWQSNDRQLLVV